MDDSNLCARVLRNRCICKATCARWHPRNGAPRSPEPAAESGPRRHRKAGFTGACYSLHVGFGIGTRSVQGKLIVALAAFLTAAAWSAHAQQPAAVASDKTPSEAEELQTALRANSADALRAYLQKYPQASRRSELLTAIAQLRRGEFTEWTIYEIDNQRFPQFVKLSSIRQLGDRVAAETRGHQGRKHVRHHPQLRRRR